MTLLSLQVLIESLSAGFWWYATLNPYWYSVPCTAEVKRNFGAGVCQRAPEPWSIKVRSTCAKLSTRQVCLWARESQAQLAFWSRAHRLFFCLPASGCQTYLSGPVVVRWQKREGIYGGRGRFFQWAWQLPLSSRTPGHCSILCYGKFTLLAAATLLGSLGFYQMAELTLVVWRRSIEGERQAERGTI